MKKGRQEKIIELINKYEIETQDELMEFLNEEGYQVTQATVSRDIRDLNLVKVALPGGSYKYIVSGVSKKSGGFTGVLNHSITDAAHSVICAQNIVVIKTAPGMAQAIAVSLERVTDPQMLGCVAGDDTILAVASDNDAAIEVASRLKKYLSLN
jgi:transcriptional regulator of arginine metabolism